MTAESLAKVKTVNEFLKVLGTWALIGAILWAISEIRDTKAMVIESRRDQAVLGERLSALTERVTKVEGRLDRHEDRETRVR